MIFKPELISKMWDTWMYFHDGTYYLYILITERSPGEGILLATSKDAVHWHEEGIILEKAEDAQWLGTGSVWKSSTFDQDGTFIMNFSEWRGTSMNDGQQTIFFAASTDLVHWTRLGNDYEFKPDPRWYRLNESSSSRWDCIYTIPRPGGGLYGYWTGNPVAFHPGFGFGETLDGKSWRALPPPEIDWGNIPPMVHLEIGGIERFGEHYYAMLGSYTAYFGHSMGMFLFTADQPEGPFTPVVPDYELLTSPETLRTSYFSRFFPTDDGILVNHQVMTRDDQRYFALLKQAGVDPDGTFRLRYWAQNDCLKSERIELADTSSGNKQVTLIDPAVDTRQGLILEGVINRLTADISTTSAGIYFEQTPGVGTAIFIGANGQVDCGQLNLDSQAFTREDHIKRHLPDTETLSFRLFARHSLIELYLDDVFIQAFSLPEDSDGRVGLINAAGAAFSVLSAYRMSL